MFDPREFPAFWGMAGGVLFGALEVVTAYSARVGDPVARRRAWLRLALGAIGGPILAESLTPTLTAIVPALDMRAISTLLGWLAAKDPRAIFKWLQEKVFSSKGQPDDPA